MKQWTIPYIETVSRNGTFVCAAKSQADALSQFRRSHPTGIPERAPHIEGAKKAPATISVSTDEHLTVCITSFRRGKYLDRAIASAVSAGVDFITVASMLPDDETRFVLGKWQRELGDKLTVAIINSDLGCNELWLQAVYRSRTERVIVLHDDDFLQPGLGKGYRDIICPAMRGGAGFASWQSASHWDDGRVVPAYEYFRGETGITTSDKLAVFVSRLGVGSLSPIVSVLRRSVLIAALKEAHQNFIDPKFWLHPRMLLGTEILVYLRHCAEFPHWIYVNEVLSGYGCHSGSGTIAAQQGGTMKTLTDGYDLARKYFQNNRTAPVRHHPRLKLVYFDVKPVDKDEARRFSAARQSWEFHFSNGDVLEYPVKLPQMSRSSATMNDPRPVPYVRDLFDYGCRFAMPEDIVVYVNRDIGLTIDAPERIISAVDRNGGATVAFRRNLNPTPNYLYRNITSHPPDGGFDLMAFTPKWWSEHRDQMPDMVIGREAWDTCFRTLIDEHVTGKQISVLPVGFWNNPAYLDNAIWHESHLSYWIKERKTNPSQLHNRALAKAFFEERGNTGVLQQLERGGETEIATPPP